jgi:hypothetical protein
MRDADRMWTQLGKEGQQTFKTFLSAHKIEKKVDRCKYTEAFSKLFDESQYRKVVAEVMSEIKEAKAQ